MGMSMGTLVRKTLNDRFEDMMISEGAFPEVQFKKSVTGCSYLMMEYSTLWARFSRTVDNRMKDSGLDLAGVWTRKRSKAFIAKLGELVKEVTEEEVRGTADRFKTMWD